MPTQVTCKKCQNSFTARKRDIGEDGRLECPHCSYRLKVSTQKTKKLVPKKKPTPVEEFADSEDAPYDFDEPYENPFEELDSLMDEQEEIEESEGDELLDYLGADDVQKETRSDDEFSDSYKVRLPAKKKRKKKSKPKIEVEEEYEDENDESEEDPIKSMMKNPVQMIATGVGVLCGLAISTYILTALGLRGGGDANAVAQPNGANPANVAQENKAPVMKTSTKGKFFVVESIPASPLSSENNPDAVIRKLKPEDPKKIKALEMPKYPDFAINTAFEKLRFNKGVDFEPRWFHKVGTPVEESGFVAKDDLAIPIERILLADPLISGYAHHGYPIMADQDGPFAIVPRQWEEKGFVSKEDAKQIISGNRQIRTIADFELKNQPEVPLYDLRTGKIVGEFAWNVPFWHKSVLSPDGEYLIGPRSIPKRVQTNEPVLNIWKKGELDGPVATVPIDKSTKIRWISFLNSTEFVFYSENTQNEEKLEFWNVDGTQKAVVPLEMKITHPIRVSGYKGQDHWPIESHFDTKPNDYPNPLYGDISPDKKLIAIVNNKIIAVVSTENQKLLGYIGESKNRSHRPIGFGFTKDGYQLQLLSSGSLMSWSMIDGTPNTPVRVPMPGSLSAGNFFRTPSQKHFVLSHFISNLSRYNTAYDFKKQKSPLVGVNQKVFQSVDATPVVRFECTSPTLKVEYRIVPESNKSKKKTSSSRKPAENQQLFLVSSSALTEEIVGTFEGALEAPPKPTQAVAAFNEIENIETIKSETPESWTAVPATQLGIENEKRPPIKTNHTPEAWSKNHAAVVRVENNRIFWDQFDLTKEEPNGKSVAIYYEVLSKKFLGDQKYEELQKNVSQYSQRRNDYRREYAVFTQYKTLDNIIKKDLLFDLSPDGTQLAILSPSSFGTRIDIFDVEGNLIDGFIPYEAGQKIKWFSWSTDKELFTANEHGQLTLWEIPNFKPKYSIEGQYRFPFQWSPSREWLAVSAGTYIDILDPKEGKLINRLTGHWLKKVVDIAIRKDGKELAAIVSQLVRSSKSKDGFANEAGIGIWNLENGEAKFVSRSKQKYNFVDSGGKIHWLSNDFIAAYGKTLAIYNINSGRIVAIPGTTHRVYAKKFDFPFFIAGRDGILRNHCLDKNRQLIGWRSFSFPDPDDPKQTKVIAKSEDAPKKEQIRIEMDTGIPTLNQQAALRVAYKMRSQGFEIGPNGWILRVTAEVMDSNDSLSANGLLVREIRLPKVVFKWEMLNENGTLQTRGSSAGSFLYKKSRFYQKPPKDPRGRSRKVLVERWNFPKNPRTAIAEEIIMRGEWLKGGIFGSQTAFDDYKALELTVNTSLD